MLVPRHASSRKSWAGLLPVHRDLKVLNVGASSWIAYYSISILKSESLICASWWVKTGFMLKKYFPSCLSSLLLFSVPLQVLLRELLCNLLSLSTRQPFFYVFKWSKEHCCRSSGGRLEFCDLQICSWLQGACLPFLSLGLSVFAWILL